MTQHGGTESEALDRDKVMDKAWGRIGLTHWDQMAWFVKLASYSSLNDLSGGDIQNLLEECQAIHMIPVVFHAQPPDRKRYPFQRIALGSPVPTKEDLTRIHLAIRSHLECLADGENVSIGPITLKHTTFFIKSSERERNAGFPRTKIYPQVMNTSASTAWKEDFLIRFSRLLEEFVDAIRRCPHCNRIFLQFRKNSRFCSKACYSVAGMRKLRARRSLQATNELRPLKRGKSTRSSSLAPLRSPAE